MSTNDDFRQIALSFNETAEVDHFEKRAFRSKRKIFATLLESSGMGVALLSLAEQYVFCKLDEKHIYPVPNKWGSKGATYLDIKHISKKLLKEILLSAYELSFEPSTKGRK